MKHPGYTLTDAANSGVKIPGGCDSCDAFQCITEDEHLDGLWHSVVHHDDRCRVLKRERRRSR